MLEAVTIREIQAIFTVTDRLGISRELIVIPLAPRHPGRVRKLPSGKLEIVVEAEGEFDHFLAGLEAEIARALGGS
jgi:hypothetical protein